MREPDAVAKRQRQLSIHHVVGKPLWRKEWCCRLLLSADTEKSFERHAALRSSFRATQRQKRDRRKGQSRRSHCPPPGKSNFFRVIRNELLPQDPAALPSWPDKSQKSIRPILKPETPAELS